MLYSAAQALAPRLGVAPRTGVDFNCESVGAGKYGDAAEGQIQPQSYPDMFWPAIPLSPAQTSRFPVGLYPMIGMSDATVLTSISAMLPLLSVAETRFRGASACQVDGFACGVLGKLSRDGLNPQESFQIGRNGWGNTLRSSGWRLCDDSGEEIAVDLYANGFSLAQSEFDLAECRAHGIVLLLGTVAPAGEPADLAVFSVVEAHAFSRLRGWPNSSLPVVHNILWSSLDEPAVANFLRAHNPQNVDQLSVQPWNHHRYFAHDRPL
jgi:hypothetical protein